MLCLFFFCLFNIVYQIDKGLCNIWEILTGIKSLGFFSFHYFSF